MFDVTVERKRNHQHCNFLLVWELYGDRAVGFQLLRWWEETTGDEELLLSCPMNYNYPWFCQQWQMSGNS